MFYLASISFQFGSLLEHTHVYSFVSDESYSTDTFRKRLNWYTVH